MPPTQPSLLLIRRVEFSSGHRYWLPSLTAEQNKTRFGRWASPYNHGHNYVLDVSIEGYPDDETGMVVNIKSLDALLQQRVVARFDQKSINDEVPELRDKPPTLETLLSFFRETIAPDGDLTLDGKVLQLVGLRLEEYRRLWAEWNESRKEMTLTRTYEFAASHRLHVPTMSEEENWRLFGKCNNAAGHGHNYIVEVTVKGTVDTATGMMVDLMALDDAINKLVVDRYDHKNLNEDLPEFKGKVTTSEALTQEIFDRLEGQLPIELTSVRLFETGRSSFEVRRA